MKAILLEYCLQIKSLRGEKNHFETKYFYGCSRYPDCTYSAPIEEVTFNKEDYAADFNWEQPCPICESEMKVRHGRYGAFLGCTRYPECKGIINIPKKGEVAIPQESLPACPAIECPGHMVARKSRFGKTFYSCSTFPDCDVIVNQLDQLPTKYPDHPRTPFQKKDKKGKAKTSPKSAKTTAKSMKAPKGKKTKVKASKTTKVAKTKATRTMPAYHLSPELTAVVGASELSRGEVTKKIWDYIKAHNLHDETNKRLIRPNDLLAKVFGSSEPVDMFKMAGLISVHIQSKQ